MKIPVTLSSLGAAFWVVLPGWAQQPAATPATLPAPTGQVYKKKLPDDLPQAKLLFIRYSAVPLPDKRPKEMARRLYAMQQNHNEASVRANEQLVEAAARYPYEHRVTTLDSVAYYRALGYKYMLMQSSFKSMTNGSYQGTSVHGFGANASYSFTYVNLYVQDLATNDRYMFDEFSEKFIYYYKGQVGMLLKKVDKQFKDKKS